MAEQACGITYNAHGLLLDGNLRSICPPLKTMKADWCHIYLCKGVGGDELWNLLQRMKECTLTYVELRNEVIEWNWPLCHRSQGKDLWQICSDKRAESNRDAGCWKSGCSEFLCVAPIVLFIADRYVRKQLPGEVESFRRLCEVIDFIVALKIGFAADTAKLHALIEAHIEQHNLVYGNSAIVPKWHDALHLADQYERDGFVFDTMCNERDHQNPKAFAEVMRGHKKAFERFVLCRSLAHQMKLLKAFSEHPCLLGPITWAADIGAHVARRLTFYGLHVAAGDFVVTEENEAVEVKLCGSSDGTLFLLGHACEVFRW